MPVTGQARAAARAQAARRALAGRPPPKFRRPPRPLSTARMEAEYRRLARATTKLTADLVREVVVSNLPALEQRAVVRADVARVDADWVPELETLIADVRSRWETVTEPTLGSSVAGVGSSVSDTNLRSVKRQVRAALGVDVFLSEPDIDDTIASFVADGRRHLSDLNNKTLTDIQRVIISGFRGGKRAEAIAEEIGARTAVGDSRAALIATDQVQKLNGALTRSRQVRLGFSTYIWRTMQDSAVRGEHAAREGRVFRWDDPPPDGHPGEAVRCRCFAEPNFEDLA